MDNELQELNEKLLRFAGFVRCQDTMPLSIQSDNWWYPNAVYKLRENKLPPDFTSSLDAQVKWLWPELRRRGYDYELIGWNGTEHKFIIVKRAGHWCPVVSEYINKEPALSSARAIEQLIDNGGI